MEGPVLVCHDGDEPRWNVPLALDAAVLQSSRPPRSDFCFFRGTAKRAKQRLAGRRLLQKKVTAVTGQRFLLRVGKQGRHCTRRGWGAASNHFHVDFSDNL